MDRFLTCAMGFGVFAFAGLICFAECSQPKLPNYKQEQDTAVRESRGEYYTGKDGGERFRYFDSQQ